MSDIFGLFKPCFSIHFPTAVFSGLFYYKKYSSAQRCAFGFFSRVLRLGGAEIYLFDDFNHGGRFLRRVVH